MEIGENQPLSLGTFLPAQEKEWGSIAKKYGLKNSSLQDFLKTSGQLADIVFYPGPISLVSDNARHQAGFHDVADTTASVCELLKKMIAQGLLPQPVK